MAVLLQDDFNRADSTTSLGSPVVGGPYTVRTGTWGINSGAAYTSASTANAQVTFPAAANVSVSLSYLTTNSSGVMFRWIDANNYWLVGYTTFGRAGIMRSVAGTPTAVFDVPYTLGDQIGAVAFDKTIYLIHQGRAVAALDDSWAGGGYTLAGMRVNSSTAARIADVLVQDATGHPTDLTGVEAAAAPHDPCPAEGLDFSLGLYKGRDTAIADEGAEA